jgi:zinc transporter ZupT
VRDAPLASAGTGWEAATRTHCTEFSGFGEVTFPIQDAIRYDARAWEGGEEWWCQMNELTVDRVALASLLSGVAASSLLVGAALGLFARPSQWLVAAVMGFGSGALIQALALELAFENAEKLVHEHKLGQLESWLWVATGFVLGGIIYYEANRIIEQRGGHLRKPARMKAYLFRKYAHLPHAFGHLHIPTTNLPHVSGIPGLAFQHHPAATSAEVSGTVACADLATANTATTSSPTRPESLEGRSVTPNVSIYEHGAEAALAKEHGGASSTGSAATAIFLGALLDGIPESIVIGANFVALATLNPTFLVAVFLSNLPEAMSSASGMRRAGFSTKFIFGLWVGLVIASAICAALGNIFLASASPTLLTFVEAIAGGGILAMLSSTMMPEAFEHGGPSVGLATIAGFLSAFFFTAISL